MRPNGREVPRVESQARRRSTQSTTTTMSWDEYQRLPEDIRVE
jgi:hypothetical protein